jgi:hypothetical protein
LAVAIMTGISVRYSGKNRQEMFDNAKKFRKWQVMDMGRENADHDKGYIETLTLM